MQRIPYLIQAQVVAEVGGASNRCVIMARYQLLRSLRDRCWLFLAVSVTSVAAASFHIGAYFGTWVFLGAAILLARRRSRISNCLLYAAANGLVFGYLTSSALLLLASLVAGGAGVTLLWVEVKRDIESAQDGR